MNSPTLNQDMKTNKIEDLKQKIIKAMENNNRPMGGSHWRIRQEGVIDDLLSLLTSEVEKERERLLKEVEEKVIGDDDDIPSVDVTNQNYWEEQNDHIRERNQLRAEQRKALSDIGGRE